MNAPANISKREENAVQQSAAFFSLSQRQRRLAHEYKRWALEDAAEGFLELSRRHKAESDRLWNDAKWHLNRARMARQ